MRRAVTIELSAEERRKLEKHAASGTTPVHLAERSKIVLMADAGETNKAIARTPGVTERKVGCWRKRYAEGGLAAIEKDRPRGRNHGGKNTEDQLRLRGKVIEMTTRQRPPDGETHWSTRRRLGTALNASHGFVHRTWRSFGLKPHLTKTFEAGTDPRFEEKLRDVVGLHLDPPENAVVFSVDEKSSIQALDRSQPGLPLTFGHCATTTHDCKRHGTRTLIAALEVATGKVIGVACKRNRHQEFLAFLKKLERRTRKDKDISIVVNDHATQRHAEVRAWIERT